MPTMVGMQSDFMDAMKELIELEYDAVEAYEVAIEKLENASYKAKLEEFVKDHMKHIKELSKVFRSYGETPPKGPSLKQWLTKGKVFLANLINDDAIISAMLSNEADMVSAYKRMKYHEDKWEESVSIIERALRDEERHKDWMEHYKG